MAEAFSDRLNVLYRISQTINSSLDLDVVMETLMDEVIAATHAERGFLMLYDEAGKLAFRTARGMDQREIEESEFKISRGIVERVGRQALPLLTSNAQMDERLDKRASVKLYGLRSVICVPILLKDRVLGVIYVDNRFQNGIFSKHDLELLGSIASSAGIAIENARLYQIAVEKGRMERELQMAREVQIGLIPPNTPSIKGWEIAACWKPAHEVSGDFYDFFPIPENGTGVVVADVSDKGMPAALFMALSRSIIRSVAGQHALLSEDIIKANRLIWQDAAEEMFITLFYATLKPDDDHITYVNAGHNPPLVIRTGNGQIEVLHRTGMAAGVEKDSHYEQGVVRLEHGDFLLIYTDGVTDALKNGEQELQSAVRRFAHLNAPALTEALQQEVCNINDSSHPVDDITMLVIKRMGGG